MPSFAARALLCGELARLHASPLLRRLGSYARFFQPRAAQFHRNRATANASRQAGRREVFPRYVDRVHIGAVLAHCGRVCTRAEALFKTAALREITAAGPRLTQHSSGPTTATKPSQGLASLGSPGVRNEPNDWRYARDRCHPIQMLKAQWPSEVFLSTHDDCFYCLLSVYISYCRKFFDMLRHF